MRKLLLDVRYSGSLCISVGKILNPLMPEHIELRHGKLNAVISHIYSGRQQNRGDNKFVDLVCGPDTSKYKKNKAMKIISTCISEVKDVQKTLLALIFL